MTGAKAEVNPQSLGVVASNRGISFPLFKRGEIVSGTSRNNQISKYYLASSLHLRGVAGCDVFGSVLKDRESTTDS